mmetsp:Transcript_4441/g.4584  ORF Transcript_4441/g.4584 Transcript_4441/m.4584 type:complete len:242 (-) Transcript_4441:67-792(-)
MSTSSEAPQLSLLVEPSQKLHQRISDFTQLLAKNLHYFLPGTRVNQLKEITDWMNSSYDNLKSNLDNTVFWMTGDAGTGKSIISAKVLHLQYDNSLIGWHFCQHSNPLENTSIAILESMSGIMASRLPAYETAVADVDIKALETAKAKDNSMDFYKLLFEAPLNAMEPPTDANGKTCLKLIIIDAFDEIHDEQLDKFLKVVTCFSELPPWIRLFLTSRRYDKILKSLSAKVSFILEPRIFT